MDEPLSDWLKLREGADAAARSRRLTQAIVARAGGGMVNVLDLATGAGSNLRYLMEHFTDQRWLVVDRSATLLAHLRERTAAWAAARGHQAAPQANGLVVLDGPLECHVETRQMDLGALDSPAIFAGRHLVTGSALLDLVSGSWLRSLAGHCRTAGAAALFTLSYNGRNTCSPLDPEDAMVFELFNAHQHTDKGLGGAAAGPGAAERAVECFEREGYHVETESSDWSLGPHDSAIQRFLIDGWAHAAGEMTTDQASIIEAWRQRRLVHVDAGVSQVEVGHTDIAAWLPKS